MTVKAYAKINLMLDITGKLENGYHTLYSVMQTVSLHDTVEVTRNKSGKITVECPFDGVPQGEENIAYKAAESFFDYCKISDRGVHIKIDKRIPHGAGLGGGSADAAAVINVLCSLYDIGLRNIELIKIAARVGADVPFCLFGGTALAQNIGDVLSPLPDLPECYIIIAKPQEQVKTELAYGAYDSVADRIRHFDRQSIISAVMSGNLNKICIRCGNVFEQCIEVCDRVLIKSVMRKYGAKATCMSGSGTAVFGIFEDKLSACGAYDELKKLTDDTFACKPVKYGCEMAGK